MSIFDSENRPGRDRATGWFSMKQVGDKIGGKILDIFFKEDTGMGAQRCFTLQQENGEVLNFGVKTTSTFLMSRTDGLQIGDEVGFSYDKDVPSKKFPGKMAKSIGVFIKLNGERTAQTAGSVAATAAADEEVAF